MEAEPIVIKIERREVPVVLQTDGADRHYVIKQFLAGDRNKYVRFLDSKSETGPDGKRRLKAQDGIDVELLVHCLYEEGGARVKREVIEGWPTDVIDALAERASEINLVTKESVEAAGNA